MHAYFDQLERVGYEGPIPLNALAFRHYNPQEVILGKTMAEHRVLPPVTGTRSAGTGRICSAGAFDRPWQKNGDALQLAKLKADVAFEFFYKLNVPYYCFHDVDVSPEGDCCAATRKPAVMTDKLLENSRKPASDCCGVPRTALRIPARPARRPARIRKFSRAASQCSAMQATQTLGGENYVGGREGVRLLNTDLRQEREQIGRFMQMVVEHKHKIGFRMLLIEPKPQEPTKHQYDFDVATVYGFSGSLARKRDQSECGSQPCHAGGSLFPP